LLFPIAGEMYNRALRQNKQCDDELAAGLTMEHNVEQETSDSFQECERRSHITLLNKTRERREIGASTIYIFTRT